MSLTSIFCTLYILSGLLTLIVGVFRSSNAEMPILATFLGGSIALMMAVLSKSRLLVGVHQAIFNIFLFGVYMTMFFPFIILATFPNIYIESGLKNGIIFGVSDKVHLEVLMFTGVSIVAVFLGIMIGFKLLGPPKLSPNQEKPTVGGNALVFLIIGLSGLFFQIILDRYLGAQSALEQEQFGMFMRLVPSSVFLVVVFFLWFRHRARLSPLLLLLCCLFVVTFALISVLAGRRGFVLSIPFIFIITAYLIRPDFSLGLRTIVFGGAFLIALVPLALAVTTVTKNVAKHDGYGERSLDLVEVSQVMSSALHLRVFRWFGGRFTGYQTALLLSQGADETLAQYAKPKNILFNIVRILFPDRLLPESFPHRPTLGKAAGMVIGGASLEQKHSGSWFGLPFLKGFFGWFGVVVAFLIGATLAAFPRLFLFRGEILSIIFITLVYNVAWSFNLSGNVDILIAEWLQYTLVFLGLVYLISIVHPARLSTSVNRSYAPPVAGSR